MVERVNFINRETNIFNWFAKNNGRILFDVTNFYLNCKNFKCNLNEYITKFPIEYIQGIHISGHEEDSGWLIDSHMRAVSDEVLSLLYTVLKRSPADFVILERDNNSTTRDEIIDDLDRIRCVWDSIRC